MAGLRALGFAPALPRSRPAMLSLWDVLGDALARGTWGLRARGTSGSQTPTSAHARFRAGNGEERGRCSGTTPAAGGNACPPPLPVSPPLPNRSGAAAGGPRPLAACLKCPVLKCAAPGAVSRPGAAHLRTGGEEECPRTGDTNQGCNYLVRGYSPSMHFFHER